MHEQLFSFKNRLYFTGVMTIAIWSLLAWDHYHGGVPSHHLLARKDLPSISNWWGGLWLPLLSWFLLYRIHKRFNTIEKSKTQHVKSVVYGFTGALIFGLILSAFFTFGNEDIPGYMLGGALLFALFFPIYRSECILGYVMGLAFTFGTILPTIIGSILASIGAVLYLYARPGALYLVSKIRQLF